MDSQLPPVDLPPDGPLSVLVTSTSRDVFLARSGAELVALSERFFSGSFALALALVGFSAIAALALLPFRSYQHGGGPPASALLAPVLVLALAATAAWRFAIAYRAIRRSRAVQVALVSIAAYLVAGVRPLNSDLWWPSCAILMLLATVTSLRRVWAYSLLVLLANLGAHVLAGDLGSIQPVTIIGLWIGYPFWTATFGVIPDQMASFLLRLDAMRAAPRPSPRRVRARVYDAGRGDDSPTPDQAERDSEVRPPSADEILSRRIDCLTARQLQVVALMLDGLRYREIAACLSISERQVSRHVASAVARTGVRTANELVALAASEGLVAATAAA